MTPKKTNNPSFTMLSFKPQCMISQIKNKPWCKKYSYIRKKNTVRWLLTIFIPSMRIYGRLWHEVIYLFKRNSGLTSWTTRFLIISQTQLPMSSKRQDKPCITWKSHENNSIKNPFLTWGTNWLNGTWNHLKQMNSRWIIAPRQGNAVGWKIDRTDGA